MLPARLPTTLNVVLVMGYTGDVLGRRALNRALLQRQLLRRRKLGTTLVIERLETMRRQDRVSVADEGTRLLAFVAGSTRTHDVQFASPR